MIKNILTERRHKMQIIEHTKNNNGEDLCLGHKFFGQVGELMRETQHWYLVCVDDELHIWDKSLCHSLSFT